MLQILYGDINKLLRRGFCKISQPWPYQVPDTTGVISYCLIKQLVGNVVNAFSQFAGQHAVSIHRANHRKAPRNAALQLLRVLHLRRGLIELLLNLF